MWIDCQHGQMGYADMLELIRACDLVGTASIVRVASHDRGVISRALDAGATGLIVPQVHTAEMAHDIVQAAKFPPLGDRSWGGGRAADVHPNYLATANRETILCVQIESPEAIENVEEIAAVEGVDALHYGPADVELRRDKSHYARGADAVEKQDMEVVVRACKANGKFMAAGGIGAEKVQLCASLGIEMILATGEYLFIMDGSKRASDEARGALGNM